MAIPEKKPTAASAANPAAMVRSPSPTESGEATAAIKAKANYPFLLAHSPGDWEVGQVDGKPTFLPVLYRVPIQPGLNGVRTMDRYERPEKAAQDAIKYTERRGHKVIPPSLHLTAAHAGPLGEGKYLRAIDCRDRLNDPIGTHWIEVWEIPIPTPPDEDQAFDYQRAPNNAFRAHLVESGIVDPPSELVMSRLRGRFGQRVGRVESTAYPDMGVKKARLAKATETAKAVVDAVVPGAA